LTTEQFIARAGDLGVDGVSLESCFIPFEEADCIPRLRRLLDNAGLERVWAWGHPSGLEGGRNWEALEDLKRHIPIAQALGANTMRIVGGSSRTRHEPHGPQIERLSTMLRDAVKTAAKHGAVLAIENHVDFTSKEVKQIIDNVGSDYLGVCFDSGNALRMFEDPVEAARRLAPYTKATHTKDVTTAKGGSPQEFTFWPSTPLGVGSVDIPGVVRALLGAGYDGLICIEVDYLKEEFGVEDDAVAKSVEFLKGLRGLS
jgi:sugar phosphate isomerase/epimerase